MENTQQATLTVPLSEWNELKALLKETSEVLQQLNGKHKSELLTPAQVCKLLNISRSSYERLVDSKVIVPAQLQKRKYTKVLIKRSDIEELLKSGAV